MTDQQSGGTRLSPKVEKWLEERPPSIRVLVERVPPDRWYHLSTDRYSRLYAYSVLAYSENGTVILVRYSIASKEPMWRVFGIDPGDLNPCPDIETLHDALSEPERAALAEVDREAVERLMDMILPEAQA